MKWEVKVTNKIFVIISKRKKNTLSFTRVSIKDFRTKNLILCFVQACHIRMILLVIVYE